MQAYGEDQGASIPCLVSQYSYEPMASYAGRQSQSSVEVHPDSVRPWPSDKGIVYENASPEIREKLISQSAQIFHQQQKLRQQHDIIVKQKETIRAQELQLAAQEAQLQHQEAFIRYDEAQQQADQVRQCDNVIKQQALLLHERDQALRTREDQSPGPCLSCGLLGSTASLDPLSDVLPQLIAPSGLSVPNMPLASAPVACPRPSQLSMAPGILSGPTPGMPGMRPETLPCQTRCMADCLGQGGAGDLPLRAWPGEGLREPRLPQGPGIGRPQLRDLPEVTLPGPPTLAELKTRSRDVELLRPPDKLPHPRLHGVEMPKVEIPAPPALMRRPAQAPQWASAAELLASDFRGACNQPPTAQ